MNRLQILDILVDWNFWRKELDSGKRRIQYLEKALRFLQSNIVLTIIGVRRSGKSYLLHQIAKTLIETGTPKENILLINLEDQRFTEYSLNLLTDIYETYLEHIKPVGLHYVLLDEIHNITGWERWVRTMHELQKAKLIISDSSSKLLYGELATLLTGRHLDLHVYPLNFKEYLSFKNINVTTDVDLLTQKIEIKNSIREYMEWGGFPEIVLTENKKNLLLSYFDDILTKDIEKRYKLKKTDVLRSLARFYLTNISRLMTFNSIKKFLDTATITIQKFTGYLEEANLVFFVKRFSYSVKNQENSARKVYAADMGLANAIGFRFSENSGRLIENIVACELEQLRNINLNIEIYYLNNNNKEVDFLIKDRQEIKQLIQVCWDITAIDVKKRELKPLVNALNEFKLNTGLIITEDYEHEEKINNKTIKYLPLWKWLLTH
jgi:hypothetical protein